MQGGLLLPGAAGAGVYACVAVADGPFASVASCSCLAKQAGRGPDALVTVGSTAGASAAASGVALAGLPCWTCVWLS